MELLRQTDALVAAVLRDPRSSLATRFWVIRHTTTRLGELTGVFPYAV